MNHTPSPKRGNKNLLFSICAIIIIITFSLIVYFIYGHKIITAMYYGKSCRFLNNIISGQSLYSIEFYLNYADTLFLYSQITLLCLIFSLLLVKKLYFIYQSFLNFAQSCVTNKKKFIFTFSIISIIVLSSITILVLQNFPNSGDEYAYIFQAETFLKGKFWNQTHPLQKFFFFFLIGERDGKWFSIFPPGWPLVLFTALSIKIPLWIVNPILATVSLLILFLIGRKIYNEKIAILSMFITFFTSYFLLNSASYYSHTLCSLLILLFVYFFLLHLDKPKPIYALLIGIALGLAFITRYYTTILCALPLLAYYLYRKQKKIKNLIWIVVGGAPFLMFLLIYNMDITGNLLRFPVSWLGIDQNKWFPAGFLGRSSEILIWALFKFILFTSPLLLLLYFIFLIKPIREKTQGIFLGSIFLSLIVGFFFYTDTGCQLTGPRFYYEGFPFLVLFTTSFLFKEKAYAKKNNSGKIIFYLFILSSMVTAPLTYYNLSLVKKIIWERKDIYRLVERENIINAIIFLETGTGMIAPMPIYELMRNGIDFTQDVFYVHDLGDENQNLIKYYPDRKYYKYHYDREKRQGYLERVSPDILSKNTQ